MIFLALRQLLSRKKQTALIILGIMIGSGAYVIISSMMLGMREFLIQQIISNDAHIKITARDEPIPVQEIRERLFSDTEHPVWLKKPGGRRGRIHIEYVQGWFDRLDHNPQIIAYTPHLTTQILIRYGGMTRTAQIIGTVPEEQIRITNIEENMKEGSFTDIGQSGNRIVAGDGLLEKLGASVSDTILITTGKSAPVPFKIVGSFHFGMPNLDDFMTYAALRDVQKINHTPGKINDISVKLADPTSASEIAGEWKNIGRDKVQSWDEANAQFLQVFKVQDMIRYLVTMGMLIVAAFGIYNVLTITVTQKKKEIAILRSIGFEPGDIVLLFFVQGFILGCLGGIAGMLFGFATSLYLSTIQIYETHVAMGGRLPVSFDLSIYIIGFTLALIASAVASVLPARAAGRLTPIEIIRSEAS